MGEQDDRGSGCNRAYPAGQRTQLCILYLISSTLKLQGEVWTNGTALYYVTHTKWFGPPWEWMRRLFENPFIVTIGTYGAVLYQLWFPVALWTKFHWLWVLIGVSFHAAIAVVMGLVSFSAIMTTLVLFTLRDEEWAAISSFLRRLLPGMVIYIDGYCPYCRRTGQILKVFDVFNTLEVRSFRHDTSYGNYGLTMDAVEREMQLIVCTPSGYQVHGGFDAVVALSRYMPLFWPLLPVAWLLRKMGYGPRVYRWLADNRLIVPESQVCARASCTISQADDHHA